MRNLLIILVWFFTLPVLQAQQNESSLKILEDGKTWIAHKVKAGETMYSIARNYQLSLEALATNNPQAAKGIKPGDLLKIRVNESGPGSGSSVGEAGEVHIILHKVQRKETFYFISRKYGVTIDEILAYNPGLSQLKRGETIRIPQRIFSTGKEVLNSQLPSPKAGGGITHWVQAGETLYSISRKYGKSVASILEENPGAGELKPGMRLTISAGKSGSDEVARPAAGYMEHTIARGETLFSVCRKYNTTADELIALNPSLDKTFKTGSVIRVPRPEEEKKPIAEPEQKEGIRHIVVSGETLFGLAREYQLPIGEIIRSNPVLESRPPKVGDTLLIIGGVKPEVPAGLEKLTPKTSAECKLKSSHFNGETFKVVLLIPIMLESNRYLNAEFLAGYKESDPNDPNSGKDSVKVTRKSERYIRFQGNSENYLHFYEGALLAIDSLRGMGIKAELEVLDSEQRSAKVKTLIETGRLNDADLIIGPIYPSEQLEIAAFASEKKIPVVSPLSGSDEVAKENPWFFQVNPSREYIAQKKSEYVISGFGNSQIIVLQTGNSVAEAEKEMQLLNDVLSKATYPGHNPVIKKVNYRDDGYTGLRDALAKGQKNVIVIPSDKEAEVSVAVSNIKSLASSYDITLIGSNRYPQFESINPESFHAGELEFLTPYWPDYKNNEVTRSFVNKFRHYYKGEPNQFSMQGYDVTFFFIKALSDFGRDFRDCIPYASAELVQGSYHFAKRPEGGFINNGLIVVQYNDNYQVVRKNKDIR